MTVACEPVKQGAHHDQDVVLRLPHTSTPKQRQHLQNILDNDWESTPLKYLSSWPPELLQICQIVLLDPQPRLLLLGDDRRIFYNEAYSTAFLNGAVDLGHVLRETEMNMPQEITNFSLQNDLSPCNNLLVIDQSRVLGSGDTQENTIWR